MLEQQRAMERLIQKALESAITSKLEAFIKKEEIVPSLYYRNDLRGRVNKNLLEKYPTRAHDEFSYFERMLFLTKVRTKQVLDGNYEKNFKKWAKSLRRIDVDPVAIAIKALWKS